ncbi:hypothetical protein V6N12_003052 [Hibiscus sabdariffa]|uniref:Uncharacterized protein n=1 Tax=Hibiscus sabdariffa TaxID=183260 RepID=A0ABR2EAS4_9ROSI
MVTGGFGGDGNGAGSGSGSGSGVWMTFKWSIPPILMDDDNIAHQTGDSLGTMIGTIIKTDTHEIDLNMVDYLRVRITLNVTKLVQRCVAIGDAESSTNVSANQAGQLDTNIPKIQLDVTATAPDKSVVVVATPNDAPLVAHMGVDPILNTNLGASMHTTPMTA